MKHILVTGGAGYIGSHACVELLNNNSQVTVVDNLCNSKEASIDRIQKITNKALSFHKLDMVDREAMKSLFQQNQFTDVIHFAGLKAVGESNDIPLRYFQNNLISTLNLLEVMNEHKVKNLVFSSSATVYGDPESVPVKEDFPKSATNPYGRTKLMIEEILADFHKANPDWNIARLRYFNPIGAHESGLIGEDPNGIPNNLLPYVSKVAIGELEELPVFGDDYDTVDGTGVRDYIHVVDLVLGHIRALEKFADNPGLISCNLGTGKGYSVLQVIQAFEKASGKKVKAKIHPRRKGDAASCYADPELARTLLGWEATRDMEKMCEDIWRWQSQNPKGYH